MRRMKAAFGTAVAVTASSFAIAHAAPSGPPVYQQRVASSGWPALEVMPHAFIPNMTAMPQSQLIAAFALTQSGQALYIDTHGTVIGRADPRTHTVVWSGISPSPLQLTRPQTRIVAPHAAPIR